MSRIVSVWLPRWPILRFLATQAKKPSGKPVDPERPFVLALTAAGGPRIAALNEAAEAAGLALGEPLADARAKAGDLQARAVDAPADDAALRRLALWATRYTPTASPWTAENGADGFFLDIEGAAHLFGGAGCRRGRNRPTRSENQPATASCRHRCGAAAFSAAAFVNAGVERGGNALAHRHGESRARPLRARHAPAVAFAA